MGLLEIEIKAWCDDHAAVADRLRSAGAGHKGTFRERDLYLNHPSRDFRCTDEALRLRQVDGRVVMTYKGPRLGVESKTRREEEVAVGEYDAVLHILTLLGFSPAGTVTKERDIYVLGEVEICLDRVEGLGSFVELEMKGTERERIEKDLFRMAKDLGLERFEKKTYLELKYGSAQGA
ncbi:MAG: class IV adenylate cyclase [Spirochaetes bacterium]|nr:class IV adenylate cyclase [Spirochaetota bacterium]